MAIPGPEASGDRFDRAGFPALHKAFSAASQRGQEWHARLFRWNLLGLLVAAVASDLSGGPVLNVIAAGAILGSIVTTLLGHVLSHADDWYEGRAVAETVKSLAWQYMTRSGRFREDGPEADALFLARLAEVVEPFPRLRSAVDPLPDRPQITPAMRALRAGDAATRLGTYLRQRVAEQKRWYGEKARHNRRAGQRALVALLIVEALAVVAVGVMLARPSLPFRAAAPLATAAAGLLAWTQLRQHRELATAYAIASQELSLIEELAPAPAGDALVAAFVDNAERAISREHTLWMARRTRPLAP